MQPYPQPFKVWPPAFKGLRTQRHEMGGKLLSVEILYQIVKLVGWTGMLEGAG